MAGVCCQRASRCALSVAMSSCPGKLGRPLQHSHPTLGDEWHEIHLGVEPNRWPWCLLRCCEQLRAFGRATRPWAVTFASWRVIRSGAKSRRTDRRSRKCLRPRSTPRQKHLCHNGAQDEREQYQFENTQERMTGEPAPFQRNQGKCQQIRREFAGALSFLVISMK